MSLMGCIKQWKGWDGEVGKTCMGQGTFLFPSQNSVSQNWLYVPGNGSLHFLNSPYRQRWQTFPKYLSLSFSTLANTCSSPPPIPTKLSTEAEKRQSYKLMEQICKGRLSGERVFQIIPHPQAPMFNYSDHISPLLLVQLNFFCFTILCHICYLLL